MRKAYLKPNMTVVKIQQMQMICGSPDVINPGAPNMPAGSRRGGYDWDEEDWDEEDWDDEQDY